MTDHTTMSKVARLEVIETGARRRWTLEQKRRIVAESHDGERQVSATARRHGLSSGLLFTWRRLARNGRLGADSAAVSFAQAVIACEAARPGPATFLGCRRTVENPPGHFPVVGAGRMEVVLSHGHRVIVDKDVDAVALGRVIDVLERRP